ncbi:MAG: hydroxymyristoyl-ACP dehydratase [Bacteroidales bacterium]|jgi:predicted hotdog family 3-hydroxylacyl-ACP dehydratase|nr:hydroxymyristoyl-ACP dehydratase [Bacteroidales bacterium]
MGIFNHVIADEHTILTYIPQRPPMVMVEKLHLAEGRKTIGSLKIKEDNIFCKNGLLHEPGIIENIAQTAAVGVGVAYSNQDKKIPTGYIGAVQKLTIHRLPALGKTILTEVNVEHEVFNTTLISGKVTCDNKPVADCTMKIYLNED